MKFKLDVNERKMLAGLAGAICLCGGLGLVAWRSPTQLSVAYDTFSYAITFLASAFMGARVWEKVGLAKQGFVPTPEGSTPAAKPEVKADPKPKT